ncbi:MAG: tetratricopeptide repeat protein [Blastocatellales bacterium]
MMKYAFLRTNISLAIIGLVLGLAGGFKLANWQYRRQQGQSLQNSVAQAANRLPQSGSGGQNLTPEQREQMVNQAKAVIDKAKSNPNDVEAQLDAADQFIQIDRPEEATEFLVQAEKANPNDSRVWHGWGIVHSMKGDFAEAIKSAKRSLELKPDNARVQMLLAVSYIQGKSNLDEAEKLLNSLEARGEINPAFIASAREDLKNIRSASAVGAGSKSVLDHGPEDPGKPK